MTETFACPECGTELAPEGLSPGRQIRCAECSTLVEVPYLPRTTLLLRPGKRRRGWSKEAQRWVLRGSALFAALVVVAFVCQIARSRDRDDRARQVATLIAESEEAEQSGHYDRALTDAEAALKLAREGDRDDAWIQSQARRRDDLARREVEGRLESVCKLDARAGLGECVTLWKRVEADPALEPLKDRVATTVARQAEKLLDDARDRAADRHPTEALDLCERALAAVTPLPVRVGGQARDDAWALATELISGCGMILEPVGGHFLQGSAKAYTSLLHPPVAELLRQSRYLLRPASSPFGSIFDDRAPFRLAIEVTENQDKPYQDTPHRGTRVEAQFTLSQKGWKTWELRVTGRTRSSVPGLGTLGASRAVMGVSRRDSQVERTLYEDARTSLLEQLPGKLSRIPEPGSLALKTP